MDTTGTYPNCLSQVASNLQKLHHIQISHRGQAGREAVVTLFLYPYNNIQCTYTPLFISFFHVSVQGSDISLPILIPKFSLFQHSNLVQSSSLISLPLSSSSILISCSPIWQMVCLSLQPHQFYSHTLSIQTPYLTFSPLTQIILVQLVLLHFPPNSTKHRN